jgi:hypothetical protein
MLSITVVNKIDDLLREGQLSHRKIAEQMGVSRSIVSAISRGSRGIYGKDEAGKYSPLTPASPPVRCPRCGYRVYMPCLICMVRQKHERQMLMQLLAAEVKRRSKIRKADKCYLRAS